MPLVDDPSNVDLIAVDWGSTRVRVSAVTRHGDVVRSVAADDGILRTPRAEQRDTLLRHLREFRTAWPAARIVAAGMIGSRNGLVETRPVAVPAGSAQVAGGMMDLQLDANTTVHVLPGLVDHSAEPDDLIRGEEAQIFGWLSAHDDADNVVLVLPGTHSKWVRVRGRAVITFRTFLTGELFARIVDSPSFVDAEVAGDRGGSAREALPGDGSSEFDSAVRLGLAHDGLLHDLFAARSRMLSKAVPREGMRQFLSGLLIGYEIGEAVARRMVETTDRVVVIGDGDLQLRYVRALRAGSIAAEADFPSAFDRGIAAIVRDRDDPTADSPVPSPGSGETA